jgi:hypothetical protein
VILVTGCPRSGTAYTAGLLQAHGLDIPHERVGRDGTVSWMFAVDAPGIMGHKGQRRGDYEWKQVVHLVRHPVKCIASLTTIKPSSWVWIAKQCWPVAACDDKWERALTFWVKWNQACESLTDCRVRVEDLPPHPRGQRISRNSRAHETRTWGELARLPGAGGVEMLAERYGYELA